MRCREELLKRRGVNRGSNRLAQEKDMRRYARTTFHRYSTQQFPRLVLLPDNGVQDSSCFQTMLLVSFCVKNNEKTGLGSKKNLGLSIYLWHCSREVVARTYSN